MMKHVVDFEGRMYGPVTYIGLNGLCVVCKLVLHLTLTGLGPGLPT